MGKIAEYLQFLVAYVGICQICSGTTENCKNCKMNCQTYPPDFMFWLGDENALKIEKKIMEIMEEE